MKKILFSWIGQGDLIAKEGKSGIERAVVFGGFKEVHLLANLDPHRKILGPHGDFYPYTEDSYESFKRRLETLGVKVQTHLCELKSPTDFSEVYCHALSILKAVIGSGIGKSKITYHLSSGTAPMIAMWVIIAKTQFKGEFIETRFPDYVRKGKSDSSLNVERVEIPFEITAEYLPEIIRNTDTKVESAFFFPPAFEKVLGKSKEIQEIIKKANYVATRGVTVLLEGESGTGKELFAEAIHKASSLSNKPFVAVNCGAIPENLIESELFGYEKGAFTGASSSKIGLFESANGGTVFLDEIGETGKSMQVKLLRVLQNREIRRVGGNKTIPLNVRIIAATNRDLFNEVKAGRFREDLFYRLAVAVIRIPPLRDRQGDIPILLDEFVKQQSRALGLSEKKLSPEARQKLVSHSWPGNVRELINLVTSFLVWSESKTITSEEVLKVLRKDSGAKQLEVLERPFNLAPNFLDDILDEVSAVYIERALKQANGNIAEASRLLGFKNYQTFNNRRMRLSGGEK